MRCLIGDTLFVSVVILFGLVFVLYRFLFRDTDSLSTTVLVVIVYCRFGQYHRISIRRLNFPVVRKGCLICLFCFASLVLVLARLVMICLTCGSLALMG